jgi:hypothetical protein
LRPPRVLAALVVVVLAAGCGAYPPREGAQRGQPAGAGSAQAATAPRADVSQLEAALGIDPVVPVVALGGLVLAALVVAFVTLRRELRHRGPGPAVGSRGG